LLLHRAEVTNLGKTKQKKIIGLSCGRVNGNCEILLKEALMAAEELGVQSEIIRAMELRVRPCKGCEACTIALGRGKEPRYAITNDDVPWILAKILMEDGRGY
jgi:multimeric flavodoxin WrbA